MDWLTDPENILRRKRRRQADASNLFISLGLAVVSQEATRPRKHAYIKRPTRARTIARGSRFFAGLKIAEKFLVRG